MNSDRKNQTFTLADNFILGFAEYGPVDGKAVFHFNGSGGSRLGGPVDESILTDLGIRYIFTDRPGFGISSPVPDRKLQDWPENVAQLADHLGIDKFHVLGSSAGGAYALICAYKLPERIISGALVSGLAPPDRPKPYRGYSGALMFLLILIRTFPKLAYPIRRMNAKLFKNLTVKNADKLIKIMPKIDQKPFKDLKVKEMFIADIKESLRQGGNGVAQDDIITNSAWGFDIRDVQTTFDIWHGDKDKNVPINQGLYQAKMLPNSQLHLVKGKGHMLLLHEWKNILVELVK